MGSPGNKKIADFLCDQKVAREQRGQVAILLSDDTIIALLGYRIAHEYRITPKTIRVARIQWSKFSIDPGNVTACNDNPHYDGE
jgi:tRNA(Ile)-lysidine synthase